LRHQHDVAARALRAGAHSVLAARLPCFRSGGARWEDRPPRREPPKVADGRTGQARRVRPRRDGSSPFEGNSRASAQMPSSSSGILRPGAGLGFMMRSPSTFGAN
jgi:hypothetical protein